MCVRDEPSRPDLAWDVLRLRRLKARLIASDTQAALAQLLAPHLNLDSDHPDALTNRPGRERAELLAEQWTARDPGAVNMVEAMLAAGELTMDDVMAECLSFSLDTVERIDQLTAAAEVRRNAALRELERHRAAAAGAARHAMEDVEDAEFEDVTPPSLAQQDLTQHNARPSVPRQRSAA